MDIGGFLACLSTLGVNLETNNPLQTTFLNILDASCSKLENLMQTCDSEYEDLSLKQIECYEDYLSRIAEEIDKENINTVLFVLRIIEKKIRGEAKDDDPEKRAKFLVTCKNVRKEIIKNRRYLEQRGTVWRTFYRILKHEDYFIRRHQKGTKREIIKTTAESNQFALPSI
jgi:hypothetical protein